MKLLTVGSSPQSNIQLNSPYVSGYHADILLLDNGDVMITDHSSTNGTFLNGSKLSPNVEILIRRGDNVVFADTPLDWRLVPELKADLNTKKIISIGSHPRNQIHVSGSKVSRFHATIKQTNDGKWSICDHSVNGTTVNNVRIPKDTFVRLKNSDSIRCAGVPVENPLPKKSPFWKYLLYGAAAVLVCGLIGLGVVKLSKGGHKSGQTVYEEYSPSTVLIYMGYHYKVSAGSLNVISAFGADEFVVADNRLISYDGQNSQTNFATGFYISKDGLIATNLHVARPWLFDKNVQPVEDLVRVWLNDLAHSTNSNYLNYVSQVKVEGIVDFIYAIPHGEFFDGKTAYSCMEITASEDPEMDVAILKAMLPGHKLPDTAKFIDLSSLPDRTQYKPGTKIYTIGFPMATALQDIEKKTLEAIFSEGNMSNSNNNYDFGHSAQASNGSSGSPVFNDKGELIGIISSGYGNGFNFAVRAEFIAKLVEQAKANRNL